MRSRTPTVKLKNARKHSASSQKWLLRQLNDPYVHASKQKGYRSRASFKLLEIDEKFKLFHANARVLDLGCAPGGWLQIAMERLTKNGAIALQPGQIVGVDLLDVDPIPNVTIIKGDFLDPDIAANVMSSLGGPASVVLSDMAASSTGHASTDHLRIMALLEAAYECAVTVLEPGGAFVGKVLQGGTTNELLVKLKQSFKKVSHFKPKASRKDSAETYVVALHFKGQASNAS
ncbi:MAG: rRNA methyltransferase [Alphaproteobacteria bacterium 43-37]|nr:MAG: rRNA methyltransferase [Alphaproteobacteria bacterium 43-37]